MIIPPEWIPYIGFPTLILGLVCVLWALIAWLKLKNLGKLLNTRIHSKFLKADFEVGGVSPYIDFHFAIHNCFREIISAKSVRSN